MDLKKKIIMIMLAYNKTNILWGLSFCCVVWYYWLDSWVYLLVQLWYLLYCLPTFMFVVVGWVRDKWFSWGYVQIWFSCQLHWPAFVLLSWCYCLGLSLSLFSLLGLGWHSCWYWWGGVEASLSQLGTRCWYISWCM